MQGLFRRPSGVYVARLVVPARHRGAVGKAELIESTGTRVLAVAQIVANEIQGRWRRQLYELDFPGSSMDLLKVTIGHPLLATSGALPLARAAELTGICEEDLLRGMSHGLFGAYYQARQLPGHHIQESLLKDDTETGQRIVPNADQIFAEDGRYSQFTGLLGLREPMEVARLLLAGSDFEAVLFDDLSGPGNLFAPERPVVVDRASLHFEAKSLDAYRRRVAAAVTPEQLDAAKSAATSATGHARANSSKPMSEAIAAYFQDHGERWSFTEERKVRRGCELFVELMGDLPVGSITRDQLRKYKDVVLPTVPANENRIRRQRGTRSVTESMQAVQGEDWPGLTQGERLKRMSWIGRVFAWMTNEGWIVDDPAVGLAKQKRRSRSKGGQKEESKREVFDDVDHDKIFGASWFSTGRGELTKQGTYREFCPYYYWLPLLGLYVGGRINELSQLHLDDIRRTADGTWFIDINDEEVGKKLKTENAKRQVPVHPMLINLGLLKWVDVLKAHGWKRLFPELKRDSDKGYGKQSSKWFSGYMKRLGIPRNNTKVFHSFRHGLATKYMNDHRLQTVFVNELCGWERGPTVGEATYRKDAKPDRLKEFVEAVHFKIPSIAPFDCAAGVQAVQDALQRKNRGRGGAED